MAEEVVITFAADLSKVRQQVSDFASQVERTPVGMGSRQDRFRQTMLDARDSFAALPSTAMIGGASAGALSAAAGGFAAGAGGSGVAAAGAEVAASLRAAAAQIRAAGGSGGGMAMLPGPGMAHMSSGGMPGGQSMLPLPMARQQGMLQSSAMVSYNGGAAGSAGNNSPLAVQVRRSMAAGGGGGMPPNIINIPGANGFAPTPPYATGGGAGGGGNAPPPPLGPGGGRGRGGDDEGNLGAMRMAQLRGLFYSTGIHEASRALGAERIAAANTRYGSGMEAGLDAEMGLIGSTTSGVFGSAAGMLLDIPGHIGSKFGQGWGTAARYAMFGPAAGMMAKAGGPTDAMELAIEAKAINRASLGNIADRARNRAMGRVVGAGDGRYSQRAAGIENEYQGDLRDTAIEREQLPQDPRIRAERRKVLDERDAESSTMKAFRMKQMMMDVHDDVASFADRAQVARGFQTTGAAGRNALIRRQSRSPSGGYDSEVNAAELGAYDASEGYRLWQREFGAGIDAQSARDRVNLQPNVANVRGIWGRGRLDEENARREGSDAEAGLINQRTQYELAGYARNLINGGSAMYADNPAQIDFGQIGSSGRKTDNPGDDTGKTLQMIYDMIGDKMTEAVRLLTQVDEKI